MKMQEVRIILSINFNYMYASNEIKIKKCMKLNKKNETKIKILNFIIFFNTMK